MLVSKAARRYASALLETAKDQKSVEDTLKDILFIKNTIDNSKDLLLFLKSPVIKPDDKDAVLKSIFEKHVGKLSNEFVKLVSTKERTDLLPEIVVAFVKQYNEYAGIIEVEVRTAKALEDAQVKELQKVLEKTTSKKVEMNLKEDAELKGGLLVKIQDTVIDGTVKHKLEQLEQTFLDNAVELN